MKPTGATKNGKFTPLFKRWRHIDKNYLCVEWRKVINFKSTNTKLIAI